MTAVADIVKDAMYEAQILGQDQAPSSGDAQLVLRHLNRMLDWWSTHEDLIQLQTQSFTMTAGQATYDTTLLTNGRPVNLESMYVRLNNIDFAVDMIDNQEYEGIGYKATLGIPNKCYYDQDFPNGNFFFYPTPYAAFTCYVTGKFLLPTTLQIDDTINLQPGYEKAIVENLACSIWRPFKGSNKPIPPDLQRSAQLSLGQLKRTNYHGLTMDTGLNETRPSPDAFVFRGF